MLKHGGLLLVALILLAAATVAALEAFTASRFYQPWVEAGMAAGPRLAESRRFASVRPRTRRVVGAPSESAEPEMCPKEERIGSREKGTRT